MATVTVGGKLAEIKNYTLSSTDDVQVGFINACNTVMIQARTAVAIQVRTSRNSSDFWTIPSTQNLVLRMRGDIKDGVVQPTNIWLRSVSATPVAEVIGLYGN